MFAGALLVIVYACYDLGHRVFRNLVRGTFIFLVCDERKSKGTLTCMVCHGIGNKCQVYLKVLLIYLKLGSIKRPVGGFIPTFECVSASSEPGQSGPVTS